MNEFLLIAGMFVITFGIRFVMYACAGKISFPAWLASSLKFVPPAVLTAIIIPSVIMPDGFIDISFSNSYLIAGIFAFVIALLTNNLLKTIGLGMGFFLVLQYLSI